jgi:hypothetical protein
MNGKGDKWRKTDYKKYFTNWENIKLFPNKNTKTKIKKNKNKTTYVY